MIFDFSDQNFREIFNDEAFHLPIERGECDYLSALCELFIRYIAKIKSVYNNKSSFSITQREPIDTAEIETVCEYICNAVARYLDGFPSTAFNYARKTMDILARTPLKVYKKSISEVIPTNNRFDVDPLSLYRVVIVDTEAENKRSRVFHTPYNLRSKISTNRYSIAGYPSLYLGTSLDLCFEEIHFNRNNSEVKIPLASKFKLDRDFETSGIEINVIELALKPQDFFETQSDLEYRKRLIKKEILNDENVRRAYLLWYPLIAACSFIRQHRSDPFAAEYIVPQLVMQWIRRKMNSVPRKFSLKNYRTGRNQTNNTQLIGIRYFSCASKDASDKGVNYVFPTSGRQHSEEYPFCPVLMKAFVMTKPVFIHSYCNGNYAESILENNSYDRVNGCV